MLAETTRDLHLVKDQTSESVREQLSLVREVSQAKVQLAQRTEQLQVSDG